MLCVFWTIKREIIMYYYKIVYNLQTLYFNVHLCTTIKPFTMKIQSGSIDILVKITQHRMCLLAFIVILCKYFNFLIKW